MKWDRTWELDSIPEKVFNREATRRRAAKGPGRPRSKGPRCKCGKYTTHTAKIKRHRCPE